MTINLFETAKSYAYLVQHLDTLEKNYDALSCELSKVKDDKIRLENILADTVRATRLTRVFRIELNQAVVIKYQHPQTPHIEVVTIEE